MYDRATAEIMPTRVAKPTDWRAGCSARSIEATVVMRMKAEKRMAVLWKASMWEVVWFFSPMSPDMMNME